MLLRRRSPGIPTSPPEPAEGFEHLDRRWIALLAWLQENHVDFVLVGAAAKALRGSTEAAGPLAIVPAPYRRNHHRLCAALWVARARLRVAGAKPGEAETLAVKLNPEKLAQGGRWTLRCGVHDIDLEPAEPAGAEVQAGTSRYQELLYEANRVDVAVGVSVEAAAPEDIEHYEYLRQTGLTPEIRVSRQARVEHGN
jgi:hypothetical protein